MVGTIRRSPLLDPQGQMKYDKIDIAEHLKLEDGEVKWDGPSIPTPRMGAVFPHLHAPDTKFDADGHWKTKGRTDDEDFIAFLDRLNDAAYELYLEDAASRAKGSKTARMKKAKAKIQKGPPPYTLELDDETGEETGFYLVGEFKMKAAGTRNDGTRWTRKPAIYDAHMQGVKVGLKIGSGSVIRISFEPYPYWMSGRGTGISTRLEAVQVISLETWGGRDAESFGFGAEEDGFAAEDADDEAYTGDDDAPLDDDDDMDLEDEADF